MTRKELWYSYSSSKASHDNNEKYEYFDLNWQTRCYLIPPFISLLLEFMILVDKYAGVTPFDPHDPHHWSKKRRTFFFSLQPSLTTFLKATEPWQNTSLPSGISRL